MYMKKNYCLNKKINCLSNRLVHISEKKVATKKALRSDANIAHWL